MFTPQRKSQWTPVNTSSSAKGKAVAFLDGPPPPPVGSLEAPVVGGGLGFGDGNMAEDWRKFRDAGLLDESALERKDRDALLHNLSRLETELFDYQYNMGLLLIEKNNLASKNEELEQEVSEAREILKREQAAHLIAISEAENREKNMRKALDTEKKCVVDLERALLEMREEHSKIKDSSETTIADVNARIEVLETKRMEMEAISHSANAKVAEADRKASEIDRKLQDLEARERILKRERLTLNQEREAHESSFRKQKEDLLEWERKLQEGEQRLCESRRTLNSREETLHETDRSCKEKEGKLVELQQKIDMASETLKKMEDDINNQSADLDLKEKKFEAVRRDLEVRDTRLKEKEEMLNARETVELENLLNEHKATLDAKKQEYELEMEQKRKSLEEELDSRRQVVDQKAAEVNHLEVKLGKREQALDKKAERVKEKEKDVEVKVRALKEQEKCLKAEEKRLEVEKNQFSAEKECLEKLKDEIETMRADIRREQQQIEEERIKLGNAENERLEYLRLQSNLKQETENLRRQNELIEKEAMDLKLQREKFERDWEALDDKRTDVENELKMLAEEKTIFEKLRNAEEERLKKKKVDIEDYIQKETDSITLQKESFEATIKHERLLLSQKAENERNLMLQDYEQWRHNLDNEMQKRQKEWEDMVQEKERAFEEMRFRETRSIDHLKEKAEKQMGEMETERQRVLKERQELELSKQQLEDTRVEISKDIKALDNLSKKLKKQREQLVSERSHFGSLIERIKKCKNCGDFTQMFLHNDLQLPTMERDAKADVSPFGESSKKTTPTGVNKGSSEFEGQKSILRKCASIIFQLSPRATERADEHVVKESPPSAHDEPTSANGELGQSIGLVHVPNKNVRVDNNDENTPSVDDSIIDSEVQGIEESEKFDLRTGQRKPRQKRGAGVRRTKSVKAVVEEAKGIIGETSEGKMTEPNDSSEHAHADMAPATSARKRTRSQASRMTESEQDFDYSEGRADSVTTGGRRKRRQTVPSALPQRRYNLRHHTAAGTTTAEPEAGDKTKTDDEIALEGTVRPTPNLNDAPAQSLDVTIESERRLNVVQVSTTRSIEFTSDRIVRFDTNARVVDSNVDATKSAEDNLVSEDAKSAEDTMLSEEVNGTTDNVDEDDNASVSNENEDDEEDDGGDVGEEDEDYDHPGQRSIGKKLWKFFTT